MPDEIIEQAVETAPADPTPQPDAAPDIPVDDPQVEAAPVEVGAPTDAAPDDFSELDKLRAQNSFYEEMFSEEMMSRANQALAPQNEPQAQTPIQQQANTIDPTQLRAFEATDDELNDAYINGDLAAIRTLEGRRLEVAEHNATIKTRNETAKMLQWYLPVALAAQRFNERNPAFALMPNSDEILGKTLAQLRNSHPKDSEAQLMRRTENLLSPFLKKASSIMQQHAAKRDVGASQQPSAVTPAPRANANGQQPSRQQSGYEKAQELMAWNASRNGR